MKWKIGIFGGLATTAIVYFMLFKSIAGMSVMTPESVTALKAATLPILGGVLIGSTLLMQLLHFLKVNVFKVLVLLGTFALAMSFAGNDLVNFIGVSMAGLSSYQDFTAHPGADPSTFMMTSLEQSARTQIPLLIAAGAIMILALCLSKKSRNVIKTSVDLARQGEGDEMFGSSRIARSLVRFSTSAGKFFDDIIPERLKDWAQSRFDTSKIRLKEGAAFDEVRATVNLVVASLLIALGTSLKLPLSTTYVTFMVAMGSSLADRAWGRETAVYRLTGVVSVIGGWFITAGAAFLMAFCCVLLINFCGWIAAALLIAAVLFIQIRGFMKSHTKRGKTAAGDELYSQMMQSDDGDILPLLERHVAESEAGFMGYAADMYMSVTEAFMEERLSSLRKDTKSMIRKREELKANRRKEMVALRKVNPAAALRSNTWFHLGHNACEEMFYCLRRIGDPCREHVDNNFAPLNMEQKKDFVPLRDAANYLARQTGKALAERRLSEIPKLRRDGALLKKAFETAGKAQMDRMQSGNENLTVAYLYLNLLQESREFVSNIRHLLRAAEGLGASVRVQESPSALGKVK